MMKQQINRFWRWFAEREGELVELYDNRAELMVEILRQLKKVDPGLMVDFGLPEGEKRELIISAQGKKDLFPMVVRLVEAVPELDSWVVKAFRPRRQESMKVVYMGALAWSTDVFFDYRVNRKGVMELQVYFLEGVEVDDRLKAIAWALVENLLGEYDAAMKVKLVKVGTVNEAKDREGLLPIVRLPRVFDEVVGKD